VKHKIRKVLAVTVIILFIGISVIPSYGKIVEKSSAVLLDEDFSGAFPPEGWSTDWWTQCNSSCGGSEPPCALLHRGDFNNAYITSKAVDASNFEKFILRFRFGAWGYHYCVYFKVRVNETSPWRNYTFWDNPIEEDLLPIIYEIEIDLGSGGYADAFQVNWTITGYLYGFQDACLDDVKIYSSINNPPDAPTITGETNGKADVEYTYCIINATDPDGDDIWANFSWGEGSYSGWIGPNTSGEDICASHAWERGNYEIKAKLKDEWGLESNWSDLLHITMPKNKPFIFNFPLLSWLFERFPNAFPILRYTLGL